MVGLKRPLPAQPPLHGTLPKNSRLSPPPAQLPSKSSDSNSTSQINRPRASNAMTSNQSRQPAATIAMTNISQSRSTSMVVSNNLSQNYTQTMGFEKVMLECGIKLSNSVDNSTELTQDAALVVQALMKIYDGVNNKERFLNIFIDGFERYIRLPTRLQTALMPTVYSAEAIDNIDPAVSAASSNDSVVRLLMKVDAFQTRIANAVLEKLGEYLERGGLQAASKVDLPKLIVDSFRYLDHVQNEEEISNRFIEILPLCDTALKGEILSCFPELINGCQQAENISAQILDLMKADKSIFGFALETIGSFSLSVETLISFRQLVLGEFAEYELEDKVEAVKFLLKTAEGAGNIDELFRHLRQMDFGISSSNDSPNKTRSTQSKSSLKPEKDMQSMVSLIANIFEFNLKRSKILGDSALRVVEAANEDKDKFLDFLIVLVLYSSKRGRQIFTLIRQKLRTGRWTIELLTECFRYPKVMEFYSQSLLGIADYLIRSTEKRLLIFGSNLYEKLFFAMGFEQRQEIVAALVTHVSSGNEAEANFALDALTQLSSSKEILEFSLIVQSLLDRLPVLKLYQVRKLFALFGRLATFGDEEAMTALDDLHVFVRKNMNRVSMRQRAIGVLSALTLYKSAVAQESTRDKGVALFKIADDGSAGHVALRGIFFDELSNAIQNGCLRDKDNLNNIVEELDAILEKNCIEKVDANMRKRLSVGGNLIGTFGNVELSVALKLLPDQKNGNNTDISSSSSNLPCLLRLYLLCDWHISGNHDEVALLLDAPIILKKRENWKKICDLSASEQATTCLELLNCGNCLIEQIIGISRIDSNDNCLKILQRVTDLVMVEREFEKCVKLSPTFTVLNSDCFDSDDTKTARKSPAKPKITKKPKAPKRKAKKKGATASTQQTDCMDMLSRSIACPEDLSILPSENSDEPGTSRKEETVQQSKVSPIGKCFRDLEESVFCVLKCQLTCKPDESDSALTPTAFGYLLTHLSKKLQCLLSSSMSKRGSNLNTKRFGKAWQTQFMDSAQVDSLKEHLLIIIPQIWKHLLTCLDYFKTTSEDNDGIVDGLTDRESLTISKCVELCMECLTNYLTWLDDNESLSVMRSILASFSNTQNELDMSPLCNMAIDTLLAFSDYVPSLILGASILRGANVLMKLGIRKEKEAKLAEIADEYLKREWSFEDNENSPGNNSALTTILELAMYASTPEGRVKNIERGMKSITIFLHPDPNVDITYKSISKNTLYIWYRGLFSRLAAVAKEGILWRTGSEKSWLEWWSTVAVCLRNMLNIIDAKSSRQILSVAMIHSCGVVNAFTTVVIPKMETKLLTIYPDSVKNLFSTLQVSTRMLHDICAEAKNNQDKALMKFTPSLKRALEALIFRVKAMLAINNLPDAYSIGMLKETDLQGKPGQKKRPQKKTANVENGEEDNDEQEADEEEEKDDENDDENDEGDTVPESDMDEDGEEEAVGDSRSENMSASY